MIKWPKEIIEDIARRRCVLFLGSGVSINSENANGRRPKTWLQFLNFMLEGIDNKRHIIKLLKENDYLTACEVIKRELGTQEFNRILSEEFLNPGYIAAEIHKAIFNLDSRIVVTPNFDKIYETYANGQANGTIVVKHHYDDDVSAIIRSTGRLIIKVHGTVDTPAKMIFTRAEYASARTKYSNFYELLEALSYTHTFIFIGCGVNDPDIRLLLEDTFFKHKNSKSHVMLMSNRSLHKSVRDVLEETMNLRIITYSDKDNHLELLNSLKFLSQAVDNEREKIKIDSNW